MSRTLSSTHLFISKAFFLAAGLVVVFLLWKVLAPFAIILVTAAVAAIVLSPLATRLDERLPGALSAFLITFGTLALLVGPLCVLGVIIGKELLDVLEFVRANRFLENLDLAKLPFTHLIPPFAQAQLETINVAAIGSAAGSWALARVGGLFAQTANLAMSVFLFFISLYYLLVDRHRFHATLVRLSPFRDAVDQTIMTRMTKTVRHIVFGALTIAVLQGIFAGIGMAIFGVPAPALWGSVTMIAAEVPIVGVSLVLGPAVLYLFITGATTQAIGLLIWGVVVVGLVDNVLSPMLIKGKTNMHALFILLSILGGLQLFGPIGFILGPTILAASMVIIDLYENGILEGKIKV